MPASAFSDVSPTALTLPKHKVNPGMIPLFSDEDIVHQVRTRSDGLSWLVRLAGRHWSPAAFAVLIREGATYEEAKTIFQDAIGALYYRIAENAFEGQSALQTYFVGICKKKFLKKIRQGIPLITGVPDENTGEPNPNKEFENREFLAVLERCLMELAEPDRTIERLKLDGWGLEPIAERVGLTLRQIKEISAGCREKLINRLKKYGYDR